MLPHRHPYLSVTLASVAACLCLAVPGEASVSLGPGAGVSSSGADGGERLNVAEREGTYTTLSAGVYDVEDFIYRGTSSTGDVIPFLAVATGSNSYRIIWLGAADSTTNGMNTASYTATADRFWLRSSAAVYAGFYTQSGGRVAYAHGASNGPTDHWGTVPTTIALGGTLSGPSNANLTRDYAFSISASLMTSTMVGPGENAGTARDDMSTLNRLNIDRTSGITLTAGTYSLASFGFKGASSSTGTDPAAAAGSIVPFLAKITSGNTFQYVWTGDAVASKLGWTETFLDSSFTLSGTETLYAGFYSLDGARVAYQDGVGVTAHYPNNTYSTTPGAVIGTTTYPTLGRTYSFQLSLIVPEPGRGLLILTALSFFFCRRQRR